MRHAGPLPALPHRPLVPHARLAPKPTLPAHLFGNAWHVPPLPLPGIDPQAPPGGTSALPSHRTHCHTFFAKSRVGRPKSFEPPGPPRLLRDPLCGVAWEEGAWHLPRGRLHQG